MEGPQAPQAPQAELSQRPTQTENQSQTIQDHTNQNQSLRPVVHRTREETLEGQSKAQKILKQIILPQLRSAGQTFYDYTHSALEYFAESGAEYCKQWTDKASAFAFKKWNATPLCKKPLPSVCNKASEWAHKLPTNVRNAAGAVATSFASLPFNPFGGFYWQGAVAPFLAIPGKFLFDATRPTEKRDPEKIKTDLEAIKKNIEGWANYHFLSNLEGRELNTAKVKILNFCTELNTIFEDSQKPQPTTTLSKIQNAASSTLKASLYWGAAYYVPFRLVPLIPLVGIIPNLLTPSDAWLRTAITSSLLFAYTLGEKRSQLAQKKYYLAEDVTAKIKAAAENYFKGLSKLGAFEIFISKLDESALINKTAAAAPLPEKKEKKESKMPIAGRDKLSGLNLNSQTKKAASSLRPIGKEEPAPPIEAEVDQGKEGATPVPNSKGAPKKRLEGKVKPPASKPGARPNVVQSLSQSNTKGQIKSSQTHERRPQRLPKPTETEQGQKTLTPSVYDFSGDQREKRLEKLSQSDEYTPTSLSAIDVLLSKVGQFRYSMKSATPEKAKELSDQIDRALSDGISLIKGLVLKNKPLTPSPALASQVSKEGAKDTDALDGGLALRETAERRKKKENKGA